MNQLQRGRRWKQAGRAARAGKEVEASQVSDESGGGGGSKPGERRERGRRSKQAERAARAGEEVEASR